MGSEVGGLGFIPPGNDVCLIALMTKLRRAVPENRLSPSSRRRCKPFGFLRPRSTQPVRSRGKPAASPGERVEALTSRLVR
jgi:hypothetical protein